MFSKKIKIPNYAWWLLLFIIYSFLFNVGNDVSIFTCLTRLFKSPQTHVFFALIVINNCTFDDRFVKRVIPLIKFTVIVAAIVSVIQVIKIGFFDATDIWERGQIHESEVIGSIYLTYRESIFSFVDPNEQGLSFIPLLSVLAGFLLKNKSRWLIVFLILGGITAILSNSRYIMIAFLLILFQLIVLHRVNLKSIFKYLISSIIIVLVLYQILIYFGYNFNTWYQERLFAEGAITETTRYKAIDNFLFFFPKFYLFGSGGMTDDIRDASNAIGSSQIHVGYLCGLVYFGIIGAFFLFGFWFQLTKHLYKNAKRTKYWGAFFAFLVFLSANLSLVKFHVFFYGILFALIFDKYYSDKYAT